MLSDIQSIEKWSVCLMGKVSKYFIPAAALGTRFLPVTKAQQKEMLPIVDRPTTQYIVEEAIILMSFKP